MEPSWWFNLAILLSGGVLGWYAHALWARRPHVEPEFQGSSPPHPSPRELDEEFLSGELTRNQYEAELTETTHPEEKRSP